MIITENKVYMFSGSGRGYEIPLKALDFSVDITVDGGETETGEPPEETSAGQYGEAYEKGDSGLMDGLDEDCLLYTSEFSTKNTIIVTFMILLAISGFMIYARRNMRVI